MRHDYEKRFEDFFEHERYVELKNYLYNYLLRKHLISRVVVRSAPRLILEVGSGLSPMITGRDDVVYSELSFRALRTLRAQRGRGHYVVADGTALPFADGAFSHTVCSEVLEHVENDEAALGELARVLEDGGCACVTVPHRKFYYAADDHFVRHFRRYELNELEEKLDRAGFEVRRVKKVLGPLEKASMFSTVMLFSLLQRGEKSPPPNGRWPAAATSLFKWGNRLFAGFAWLDAKIMPRALATVIYVEGTPKPR